MEEPRISKEAADELRAMVEGPKRQGISPLTLLLVTLTGGVMWLLLALLVVWLYDTFG